MHVVALLWVVPIGQRLSLSSATNLHILNDTTWAWVYSVSCASQHIISVQVFIVRFEKFIDWKSIFGSHNQNLGQMLLRNAWHDVVYETMQLSTIPS